MISVSHHEFSVKFFAFWALLAFAVHFPPNTDPLAINIGRSFWFFCGGLTTTLFANGTLIADTPTLNLLEEAWR